MKKYVRKVKTEKAFVNLQDGLIERVVLTLSFAEPAFCYNIMITMLTKGDHSSLKIYLRKSIIAFFYVPYLFSIHEKANCIAMF